MEIRCGRRLRDENPYWIPKTETSKVCRKDEDGKRRQERKQTGVLRVDNKAKHGGRLPELASFYKNMLFLWDLFMTCVLICCQKQCFNLQKFA